MPHSYPKFSWPRFLVSFIAAPFLVTLLTFWAFIPIYALFFGGPIYLLAGLPLAAWYLQRHPPKVLPILLLAQACQLLIIPLTLIFGRDRNGELNWELVTAFTAFGALFALLWSGTFIALYRGLATAKRRDKEPPDAPT